jgi:acetyl-CoA carboxylase carboxyl transferase subunit alpha
MLQMLQPRVMRHYLDFEKPVAELEAKIEELRRMAEADDSLNIADEVNKLTEKSERQLRATYAKLTPWQKTQVARHPDRPKASDYLATLITEFTPLAGDRSFADDAAVVGGLGRFRGQPVVVLGTEKGADTESRVRHNFGMARPEGYRKARRLIELAGRFALPVLTFVDTAGAFPGIEAEARGQAESIARSIEACLLAPVPLVATIIGEGGSGGAIALAAGDAVLMLEHAIYAVISPEGCAAILWKDAAQAAAAAEALKLTAEDLKRLDLIDAIVTEPLGGAHRDPAAAIEAVGEAVAAALAPLQSLDGAALTARRREKYLAMGREALA